MEFMSIINIVSSIIFIVIVHFLFCATLCHELGHAICIKLTSKKLGLPYHYCHCYFYTNCRLPVRWLGLTLCDSYNSLSNYGPYLNINLIAGIITEILSYVICIIVVGILNLPPSSSEDFSYLLVANIICSVSFSVGVSFALWKEFMNTDEFKMFRGEKEFKYDESLLDKYNQARFHFYVKLFSK